MSGNEPGRMESTSAFAELLDFLRGADATFLDPGKGLSVSAKTAGYRHLAHLLSYGIDCYMESDPQRPEFIPLASPVKKILGDNTDSIYHFSRISGNNSYRISGTRGNDCYLSFCFYGGPDDGRTSERVTLNINHRDMDFSPDGSFEIVVAPENGDKKGRVIAPDTVCVIVRQYFFDRESMVPAALDIRCLDPMDPPAPLSDSDLAKSLRAIRAFMSGTIAIVPFPAGFGRNTLYPPFTFTMDSKNWGTPDNIYSIGGYDLDDDQALEIRGFSPPSAYWGVQTWNHYMQSHDYRHHRVSLNSRQIELEPDGSFVVHLSARDHGLKNRVSTGGHRDGIMFCRWLLADSMPETPLCRVINL